MSDLAARVRELPWFHQIDLGGGLVTPGRCRIEDLQVQADLYFHSDLIRGKTFLDVGCWDGFNSVEAHRRGALRVVANDHFAWSPAASTYGDRRAFDLVQSELAPAIVAVDLDLHQLDPATVGVFDVVLFAGVFYHLRNPLQGLEAVARLAYQCLIVETHLDATDIDRPAMVYYPGGELNGDATNWWGPNRACVEAMLEGAGFAKIEYRPHPSIPSRGIFHAWR